jgi:hypothetical protein
VAKSSLSLIEEIESEQRYVSETEVIAEEEILSMTEETPTNDSIITEKNEVNYYVRSRARQLAERHRGVLHPFKARSSDGQILEFVDGALWKSGDGWISRDWIPYEEKLYFVPDTSWFFKKYKFALVNESSNQVVPTDIVLGPYKAAVLTIAFIDPFTRMIQLNDGSCWKITGWDDFIYHDRGGERSERRWLPSDSIYLGVNNSSFGFANSNNFPFILINIDLQKFARAQLMNN